METEQGPKELDNGYNDHAATVVNISITNQPPPYAYFLAVESAPKCLGH
jgi:hypothetical protein